MKNVLKFDQFKINESYSVSQKNSQIESLLDDNFYISDDGKGGTMDLDDFIKIRHTGKQFLENLEPLLRQKFSNQYGNYPNMRAIDENIFKQYIGKEEYEEIKFKIDPDLSDSDYVVKFGSYGDYVICRIDMDNLFENVIIIISQLEQEIEDEYFF